MWLYYLAWASVPLILAALGMVAVAGRQGGFRRRGVAWMLWGAVVLVFLAVAGIVLSFGFDLNLALFAPLVGSPLAFLAATWGLLAMNLRHVSRSLGRLVLASRRLEARARTMDGKTIALRLEQSLITATRLLLELAVAIAVAGLESLGDEPEEPRRRTITVPATQWGVLRDDGSGNTYEL